MLRKKAIMLFIAIMLLTGTNCHKYLQDVIDKNCGDNENDIIFDPFFGFAVKLKILKAWMYSILSSVLVGLSGVMPLLVIPMRAGSYLRSKSGQRALNRCLSFAVGSILGDIFMHLLPETWDQSRESGVGNQLHVGLWIILGILSFLIIEKIFTEDDENNPNHVDLIKEADTTTAQNGHSAKGYNLRSTLSNGELGTQQRRSNSQPHLASQQSKTSKQPHKMTKHEKEIRIEGYMNLFANVIDNFIHGLAVGGSFLISTNVGIQTTFCIMIHEIPHEVSDFVILLRAGFNRTKAAKAQLLTASGSIIGAIFALCADSATTGRSKAWILPFTVGGFIYISLVSLTPALIKEKSPRESIIQTALVACGLGSMMILTLYCD